MLRMLRTLLDLGRVGQGRRELGESGMDQR